MTLSVRLESDLERQLQAYSTDVGLSKSEIVKQSLEAFFATRVPKKSAYELGKHLFGRYGSGQSDVSQNRRHYLQEAAHEKHRKSSNLG